jgi:hypothetical protein
MNQKADVRCSADPRTPPPQKKIISHTSTFFIIYFCIREPVCLLHNVELLSKYQKASLPSQYLSSVVTVKSRYQLQGDFLGGKWPVILTKSWQHWPQVVFACCLMSMRSDTHSKSGAHRQTDSPKARPVGLFCIGHSCFKAAFVN